MALDLTPEQSKGKYHGRAEQRNNEDSINLSKTVRALVKGD
jgi:hypothetical protein